MKKESVEPATILTIDNDREIIFKVNEDTLIRGVGLPMGTRNLDCFIGFSDNAHPGYIPNIDAAGIQLYKGSTFKLGFECDVQTGKLGVYFGKEGKEYTYHVKN